MSAAGPPDTLSVLRRFVRKNRALERCELCGADLDGDHPHLLDSKTKKLFCACGACAVLFSAQGAARYKRVPRRVRFLPGFRLTDAQWESLMIPINMAFFYKSTAGAESRPGTQSGRGAENRPGAQSRPGTQDRPGTESGPGAESGPGTQSIPGAESSAEGRLVVMYPSPAGATESQLPMEMWREIVEANPVLREMESDVEALLVNRLDPARRFAEPEYYLLPVDECYRLVGLIRTHWKGFSGGAEMWEELESFFAGLKERSGVIQGAQCPI